MLVVVLVLILGHLVQTLIWALVYLWLGRIASLADAIHFSLASYTTIGTNDIALSIEHRTLGALDAAMGVLMFGWSTALLIRVRLDDEMR